MALQARMVRFVKNNPEVTDAELWQQLSKLIHWDYPTLLGGVWPEFWLRKIRNKAKVGKKRRLDPFEKVVLPWLMKRPRTTNDVKRFWRKTSRKFPTKSMLHIFCNRHKIVVEKGTRDGTTEFWMFKC